MAPIAFLSLTVSRGGPTAFARRGPPDVVVCLRGDHDLSTIAELSATMARAIALSDADLVVDLGRVEFMSASTVSVIVAARELLGARSRSLAVRTPSRCARRVLELCDLSDLIDPRFADSSVTAAAGALGRWVPTPAVPVPAIDGIDPRAENSTADSLPQTVLARRIGAGTEVPSQSLDHRSDEHATRVAG